MAGRPRDAGRHAGDGPAGGAGASPAAVARLLALADGSGVEAVLGRAGAPARGGIAGRARLRHGGIPSRTGAGTGTVHPP